MKDSFEEQLAERKKFTNKATWVFFIIILIVAIVVLKVAVRQGAIASSNGSMPSKDDAFEVAKEIVKPTLRSADVDFSEGQYAFSKSNDSIYTIKSYYETKIGDDEKARTTFVLKFKYNGGPVSSKQSWSVLTLEKQQ